MRIPALVVLALASAAVSQDDAAVAAVDLQAALTEIVDAPDPAARRRAADAWARRKDVTRLQWREAMAGFGSFAKEPPGRSQVEVDLWVGAGTEKTTIHLYVPESYRPAQKTPLLLIGHWTGGNGKQALPHWIRVADQLGMLLVAPSEAGPNVGWAFSERERTSTLSALRYARRRFNVDENRIYCTGVSRGGHLTWDLSLRFPDRFAAIAPMIGGPRLKRVQGQNNLRFAENVAHLPIRDLQGAKDDPYLVANLRLLFARLKKLEAADAELIEFPDLGHSYKMDAVDWVAFFGKHRRQPIPDSVVRMTAQLRETRAFYVDVLAIDSRKVQEVPRIAATPKFARLDAMGQRAYVAAAVDRHTARLEVRRQGPRTYHARGTHVRSFRLLLDPTMFIAGQPVLVKFKARLRRLKVVESSVVLLREFAERFDRTFLPVAAVTVR